MSMRHLVCLSAGLALVCASLAHALEFRSVRQTGSVLYQAPVLSGKKLFVVSRYYPVEVLSLQGDWARVRDASGLIAWIQTSALSTLRMVLVSREMFVQRHVQMLLLCFLYPGTACCSCCPHPGTGGRMYVIVTAAVDT